MDLILGKVGIWTFDFEQQPMAQVREEVAELEALGYGAIWIPEVAGREALLFSALQQLRLSLSAYFQLPEFPRQASQKFSVVRRAEESL